MFDYIFIRDQYRFNENNNDFTFLVEFCKGKTNCTIN